MIKNIKVGDYDLLDSITIIDIDSQPITVNLGDEKSTLTFIFRFINEDNEGKTSSVKYDLVDKYSIKIKLINMDKYIGGGNTSLISIGTFNNRELTFNFRVFGLNDGGNTIILNFYLGKEVEHEQ